MKSLLDLQDELNELTELMFAAYMAATSLQSREGCALGMLLNTLRQRAEQARDDVEAIRAADVDERTAA